MIAPIVSPDDFLICGTNSICRGEITRSFYWEPEVHGDGVRPQNNVKTYPNENRGKKLNEFSFSQFERAVQFGLLQESPRHLFCPVGRVQRYRGGKDYAVSSASRECWSSAHNGYDPECAD